MTTTIAFVLVGDSFNSTFINQWSALLFEVAKEGYILSLVITKSLETVEKSLFANNFDTCVVIESNVVFQPQNIMDLIKSPHNVTTALYFDNTLKKYAVSHANSYVKMDTDTVNEMIGLVLNNETKKPECTKDKYIEIKSCEFNLIAIKKEAFDETQSFENVLKNDIYADGMCRVGIIRQIIQ